MGKVEKSIMNVLIALVYRNEIRFFLKNPVLLSYVL